MTQMHELSAETLPASKPRRGARRSAKPAEARGRFVRRGVDVVVEPGMAHERRMTVGLRASIVAAIAGMTLFFHAPLGAAVAALFN